jgi:hypothetical protein
MALFFVTALHDPQATIEAAIMQRFPNDYYKLTADKWFVSADSVTAKQMSDVIGLTDKPSVPGNATGIVISVGGYFGRAQPDLWEWIAAKANKSNA